MARYCRFSVWVLNAVPHRRAAAALTAASALFVLLTGCSSSDGTATPSDSGGGPGGAAGEAFTAYRDCLSRNGVVLPSANPRPSGGPRVRPSGAPPSGFPGGVRPSGMPGGGRGFGMQRPEGVDDVTWQKAQAACASLLPTGRPNFSGGPGGPRPGGGSDTAYQNCLKDNGGEGSAQAKETCAVLSPSPAA